MFLLINSKCSGVSKALFLTMSFALYVSCVYAFLCMQHCRVEMRLESFHQDNLWLFVLKKNLLGQGWGCCSLEHSFNPQGKCFATDRSQAVPPWVLSFVLLFNQCKFICSLFLSIFRCVRWLCFWPWLFLVSVFCFFYKITESRNNKKQANPAYGGVWCLKNIRNKVRFFTPLKNRMLLVCLPWHRFGHF